jgi:predicted Zn-dependent peptidase
MKFKKKVFKNGLRLITVPMKESPTATVMVMVETGGSYETKDIDGISHFLEHVCFKGTVKRPRSLDINGELDSIGSRSNAFTSHEYTGYYAKAHPKHINKITDVLSDIYLNSTFPKEEIEREKGVIIEEMNMYEDLPQRLAPYLFLKLLYGNQPAGSSILGNEKVIRKINRQDFIAYRKKHYVAEATIVVVSGTFDQKKIEKLVEKSFSEISKSKKHSKLKVIERQTKPAILIKHKKTDQTHLVLGVRTWAGRDKRNMALSVLSVILGEGMSSRLFQKLREEMGVSYYVRATQDEYTDHGNFTVSAGVDKGRLNEVIKAILDEFRKLIKTPVPEAELKKAKDYLIGNMYLGLESSDEIGGFYVTQEIVKGRMVTPKEVEKKITKVSARDVQNIAREIFKNKNLNLAVIGDVKNEKKLQAILKI